MGQRMGKSLANSGLSFIAELVIIPHCRKGRMASFLTFVL